jgi:ketosteroid isomerase-like protein
MTAMPLRHAGRAGESATRTVLLTGLALVLGGGCTSARVAGGEPGREVLLIRQAELLAAMSDRDLGRTMTHFAPDAVLHVANFPSREGSAAIRDFFDGTFRFLSASEASAGEVRVSGGGDMAYSVGRVTNVFQGPEGRVAYPGKFLLVWELRDGEWLVSVYSVSSDGGESRP